MHHNSSYFVASWFIFFDATRADKDGPRVSFTINPQTLLIKMSVDVDLGVQYDAFFFLFFGRDEGFSIGKQGNTGIGKGN